MPTEPDAATPTLAAYAARHGLMHRAASFGLPKATQLMRHGFMQEVPSLASGELPQGAAGVDYLSSYGVCDSLVQWRRVFDCLIVDPSRRLSQTQFEA